MTRITLTLWTIAGCCCFGTIAATALAQNPPTNPPRLLTYSLPPLTEMRPPRPTMVQWSHSFAARFMKATRR